MSISKLLFGEIALKKGLVSKEQVEECLEIQKKLKDMGISRTLGAVMHDKKYLTMVEIKEILREMTGTKDWNAIEGYEILGKLGKGGMGAVYKARHQKLNKIVALKVLPPELAGDQEYLDRFLREARAAAKLNHVNIVQALDVGESYGYHYFVMEYAEGKTIKDMIEDRGTLDEGDTLDYAEQVASALAHAAKNDLVHRDIKPSNIIVTPDGVAKLLDLGLAKSVTEDQTITQTGVIMGTPFYLSPEQARSEDLDTRSDLYSLGVTMFHMLTGQVPFNGNSAATILYKHIFQEPPKVRSLNPKVSAPVSEFVARLMAKSKDDRPASGDAMVEEIAAVREKAGLQRKTRGPAARGVSGAHPAVSTGTPPEGVSGPSVPPRGIDAPSLDSSLAESAAATGATPSTSQSMTAPQAAMELDISGPQREATREGRTEAIGAGKRKAAEEAPKTLADLKAPKVPRPARPLTRPLVMAGSAAYIAVAGWFIYQGGVVTPPLVEASGAEGARALAVEAPAQKPVADELKRIEGLQTAQKFGEAADALSALGTAPPKGAGKLTVADEVEVDRARRGLVDQIVNRAEGLSKEYDKARLANQDAEAIVKQVKALDLGAAERTVLEEKKALEAEQRSAGGGAGPGAPPAPAPGG
jgi:serine/threonine-protein kinase